MLAILAPNPLHEHPSSHTLHSAVLLFCTVELEANCPRQEHLRRRSPRWGCYTPPGVLTNQDLKKVVDSDHQWIMEHTDRVGTRQQYRDMSAFRAMVQGSSPAWMKYA